VVDLGEAVLDPVLSAPHGEHVGHEPCRWAVGVARRKAKLDAIVGQDGVDLVWNGCDEGDEKGRRRDTVRLLDELDEGELAGPVDGNEEMKLASGGLHLGDIDVEEADRVAFELLPGGLVGVDIGKPADTVTLQTAVQ
jgi:hypothetical protein